MLFVRASVGHSKQKLGHKLHKEDSVNGLLDDLFTLKKNIQKHRFVHEQLSLRISAVRNVYCRLLHVVENKSEPGSKQIKAKL